MKRTQQILRCLFPITGLICIFCSDHVTALLPYLLGGAMLVVGALHTLLYSRPPKEADRKTSELTLGLILLVVGIMFLIKGQNAIGAVGTVWAILGIRKAAQSLDLAIRQLAAKETFALSLLTFFVRITLALVLLFNPFDKFATHVMILGFEMVATSIGLPGVVHEFQMVFRSKSN